MCILALKALVGSGVLKHLCHGTQVTTLVNVKLTSSCHVDDVKPIWCHNGWVHVAIVQQVSYNLALKKHTQCLRIKPLKFKAKAVPFAKYLLFIICMTMYQMKEDSNGAKQHWTTKHDKTNMKTKS